MFQISDEKRDKLLVQAMCEILLQSNNSKFRIVYQHVINKLDQNDVTPVNSRSSECSEMDNILVNSPEVLVKEISNNVIIDSTQFHASLTLQVFSNISDVEKYYADNIRLVKDCYGVLLFLYSVLMTKVREFK